MENSRNLYRAPANQTIKRQKLSETTAPSASTKKIETQVSINPDSLADDSPVGDIEIQVHRPPRKGRKRKRQNVLDMDSKFVPTNEPSSDPAASTRPRRTKVAEEQDDSAWNEASAPQRRHSRQYQKSFAKLSTKTQKERLDLIKDIAKSWGTRWSSNYAREYLPYKAEDRTPLVYPKDWSTTLLIPLKELAHITPQDAAGAAAVLSKKAGERDRVSGGGLTLSIVDVEAAVAHFHRKGHINPAQLRAPLSQIKQNSTRQNTSPTMASTASSATLMADHKEVGSVRDPATGSERTDRTIKVEEDGAAIENVMPTLQTPDGGYEAWLESQRIMEEQMRIRIEANIRAADAQKRIDQEKARQARMYLQRSGQGADAPIVL